MNTGRDDFNFELAAEAITLRIRWFGLGVGYVLVNLIGRDASATLVGSNQPVLNGILTLGALYAVVDTVWSLRGKVFLSDWPLVVSLMEAVFIGLLCYFDFGLQSPFRYYYFLSLLVCAMRYPPVDHLHDIRVARGQFHRTDVGCASSAAVGIVSVVADAGVTGLGNLGQYRAVGTRKNR